mmetsp:Transcript_11688/g.18091  ORF Transcript_11688/g.18091 Transcript_11688/m.18091 type:complete len:479 (+) Transcript_11688:256-1692(+)
MNSLVLNWSNMLKASILFVALLSISQLIWFFPTSINVSEGRTKGKLSSFDIAPRIVLLAGPHKTGTSSIQGFFATQAGWTVSLLPNTTADMLKPHPKIQRTNWVWPIGVRKEIRGSKKLNLGFKPYGGAKFYAPLMYFIGEYESPCTELFDNFESILQDPTRFYAYWQLLFQKLWQKGKNLVFGSEAFDSLLWELHQKTAGDAGEEMHVAPKSSEQIDRLLDLLPWDDKDHASTSLDNITLSPTSLQSRPLHWQDIEVVVTHRTNRIVQLESLWRQVGRGETFREYILNCTRHLHTINSMALALQFARKGMKTTFINMQGVFEREATFGKMKHTSWDVTAVIACDVLQMGGNHRNNNSNSSNGKDVCDKNGRLYFPVQKYNVRKNIAPKGVDEEQLAAMNDALEEYDCGVWFHLQKYQAKGNLRILYPSKDLFATCNNTESKFSFGDLANRVRSIARRQPSNTSSTNSTSSLSDSIPP